MRAISIKQPWAWAIIHGGKDIENRTWPTRYAGPVLIHTGKKFDHAGYRWLLKYRGLLKADVPHSDDMPRGGIVGRSEILSCVDQHESFFFFGPWGWVLGYSEPVPFVPYKGKLGFFNVPDSILKEGSNV